MVKVLLVGLEGMINVLQRGLPPDYKIKNCNPKSAQEIYDRVSELLPNIVIIPYELKGVDTHKVVSELSSGSRKDKGIIVLGTKEKIAENRTISLTNGADYYLPCPMEIIEMAAWIQALAKISKRSVKKKVLVSGNLILDLNDFSFRVNGKKQNLPNTTRLLLQFFIENMGEVQSLRKIEEAVWGDMCEGLTREESIRVYVRLIRKIIEEKPDEKPKRLVTVRNKGYLFIG